MDDAVDGLLQKVALSVAQEVPLRKTLEKHLNDMRDFLTTRGVLTSLVPALCVDDDETMDHAMTGRERAWGMTAALVMHNGSVHLTFSPQEESSVLGWTIVNEEHLHRHMQHINIAVAGEFDVQLEEDVKSGVMLYANGKGKAGINALFPKQQPLGVSCKDSVEQKTTVFLSSVLESIVDAGLKELVNGDKSKSEQGSLAEIYIRGDPRPTEEERRNATWIVELRRPSPFMLKWISPEGKQLRDYGAILAGFDNKGYAVMASSSYRVDNHPAKGLFMDTKLCVSDVSVKEAEALFEEFTRVCPSMDFAELQEDFPELKLESPCRLEFKSSSLELGTITGPGEFMSLWHRDRMHFHPFTYFPAEPHYGRIFEQA